MSRSIKITRSCTTALFMSGWDLGARETPRTSTRLSGKRASSSTRVGLTS